MKTNKKHSTQLQVNKNKPLKDDSHSDDHEQISNVYDYTKLNSFGNYAQISNAGNGVIIESRGDYAKIDTSGNEVPIYSWGNDAQIGISGDDAQISAKGKNPVVTCSSQVERIILGEGGCAAIAYHDGSRTRFAIAYVGENGIKSNTPYHLNDQGKFVEIRA